MKKFILIISMIYLFTSCSTDTSGEKDKKISELNGQIESLKLENSKLREENELIKIGGIPSSVETTQASGGTTVVGANSLFPEGSTFEESNGTDCIKRAHDAYIAEGIKKCKSLGYTDAQIQKDQCQLDTTYIKTLEKQRTDAEAACGPR